MIARRQAGAGRGWRSGQARDGYTLVETTVMLLLFSVVGASAFAVLRTHLRFYLAYARIADAHDAARVGIEALSAPLRMVSPSSGDLYAAAADSLALRSTTGFGVICQVSGNYLRLWMTSGVFGMGETDSLLVFKEGDPESRVDDQWTAIDLRSVRPAGELCPNGRRSELEVGVDVELAEVSSGSPVRAFRPHVYRLYRDGAGRWWLGQRLRYGSLQPITGPFAPAKDGGLQLDFLSRGGDPTSDAAAVTRVRVAIKARSGRAVPRLGGAEPYEFSLASAVFLRNSEH